MNDVGDDPPYMKIGIGFNGNIGKLRIFGQKARPAASAGKAFDGKLSIDDSDNNPAVCRLERAVDNQNIAWMNGRACHRLAFDADKKSRSRMLYDKFVQI